MKILLAEGDLSIQAIAKIALSRVGGHEVTVVKNGVRCSPPSNAPVPTSCCST